MFTSLITGYPHVWIRGVWTLPEWRGAPVMTCRWNTWPPEVSPVVTSEPARGDSLRILQSVCSLHKLHFLDRPTQPRSLLDTMVWQYQQMLWAPMSHTGRVRRHFRHSTPQYYRGTLREEEACGNLSNNELKQLVGNLTNWSYAQWSSHLKHDFLIALSRGGYLSEKSENIGRHTASTYTQTYPYT